MNVTAITLLTAPSCRLCDDAKVVLDRVAIDFDLTIETLSIDTARGQALMIEHQVIFPPGVLINDKPFSYGRLSERRLRRMLESQCALHADHVRDGDMTTPQARDLARADDNTERGEGEK